MSSDYEHIKRENQRKYGEEIRRIGQMLLAERYDDNTHFIFEILQNAEDALKKRDSWDANRSIEFSLTPEVLTISHFGKPFDEADVLGVCGIGESTKELTDIGRFGIGFKSVYAFTDRPEIHSGVEHFAIESYVWPQVANEWSLQPGETKIVVPFKREHESAMDEVLEGLRRLGPRTLLFLREIDEISWSVIDGPSGIYSRQNLDVLNDGVRKVRLVDHNATWDDVSDDVEEEWIVFSREVFHEEQSAGHVEVAFQLVANSEGDQSRSIQRVPDSRLVVFFPTALSTNLGFIVQGPYRTTPSRDNVPQNDPWNQRLVQETAGLLSEALVKLRDIGLLGLSAIQCLPLDPVQFHDGNRFAPLFHAVKQDLLTEPLLPAYNGEHVAGQNSMLARTQQLRELMHGEQLAKLYSLDSNVLWLSDQITVDRNPDIRRFLINVLDLDEVTPEQFVSDLTVEFLEEQSDEWVERLYEFLSSQPALRRRLRMTPIVRLDDGSHTIPFASDETPLVYLPGETPTGFPTVKPSVCRSDDARSFLGSLGLRVPDPVDDVITYVLPKYENGQVNISDDEYQSDIERVLTAYDTDSYAQRNNLVAAIQKSKFIIAVDADSGEHQFVRPNQAYLATDRLASLFEDVPGVLLVDNARECLKGERIRDFLRATGTPEYLLPVPTTPTLTDAEKLKLRGNTNYTNEYPVEDYTLMGLDSLLDVLVDLPTDKALSRATLLWQALIHLRRTRRDAAFNGKYSWFYRTKKEAIFPPRFVKMLNESAWVPDTIGVLKPPSSIVFKDTTWEEDPYLASIIHFKPDILNQLAAEAGIELEIIDFLKTKGITLNQLMESFTVPNDAPPATPVDLPSEPFSPNQPVQQPKPDLPTPAPEPASPSPNPSPRFISYIEVRPNDGHIDPGTTNHQELMNVEEQAIDLILSKEPTLLRTPPNNPGYDMEERSPEGSTIRWIEVKAMTGTLRDHPVGLTRTQFEFAQEHQDDYWLYVVENAGTPDQARILRIKNPAGKAGTYTFDHGWTEVAE